MKFDFFQEADVTFRFHWEGPAARLAVVSQGVMLEFTVPRQAAEEMLREAIGRQSAPEVP